MRRLGAKTHPPQSSRLRPRKRSSVCLDASSLRTSPLDMFSLYFASTGALQTPVRSVSGETSRVAGAARTAVNGVSGPTFSKPLSMPDPIPEAGQQRALELMKTGALFRYTPGVLSETSLAEADMCEATGFKYSVGFNSAGSGLFIALKTVGVQPGDKVLANAFSFTAVPSAIHHAGAVPVYVEATDAYVMCMDDLRRKLEADDSIKYMMLTHMRGKVADMQAAYELAEEFGVEVIEDCAHALGIQWDGVQLGRSARGERRPPPPLFLPPRPAPRNLLLPTRVGSGSAVCTRK